MLHVPPRSGPRGHSCGEPPDCEEQGNEALQGLPQPQGCCESHAKDAWQPGRRLAGGHWPEAGSFLQGPQPPEGRGLEAAASGNRHGLEADHV